MNFTIRLNNADNADGSYTVRAPGCILAALSWANEYGPLADHTAFGILPLAASNGTGSFLFSGGRAIPEEADFTHARHSSMGHQAKAWLCQLRKHLSHSAGGGRTAGPRRMGRR